MPRAIEGEERLVVSSGKLLGTERRHNEALVMFLLRQRRAARFGNGIGPGSPLYDRIRRELQQEMKREASDPERIRRTNASIARKLDTIRMEMVAEMVAKFNDAISGWMGDNPGKVPQVTSDFHLVAAGEDACAG